MKRLLKPIKHAFDTTISIPGSKSITNRALLLAALAQGTSQLQGMLASDDSHVFANALKTLGIKLEWDLQKNQCVIEGCNGQFPAARANVWCQDAGTATRFLLAALAQAKGQYQIDGSERMRERPLADLITVLQQQGTRFHPSDKQRLPLHLIGSGGLNGGEFSIPGNLSSQFLSGLLMVAPFANTPVTITTENLISKPYVAMTCNMMQQFGVAVDYSNDLEKFTIDIPQHYQARQYTIEPDLSTASYFFAAAALTKSKITIPDIQRQDCLQGDIQFLDVLAKMGCEITENEFGTSLKGPDKLQGIEVDMGEFSDTFMTLAALAPFAEGPTTITNIAHTRLQESDRIEATANNLSALNIKVDSGEDYLKIYPGDVQATTLSSYNDHRIAMSFALIGLLTPGIEIEDAECVAKTCPNYFAMMDRVILNHDKLPSGKSIN